MSEKFKPIDKSKLSPYNRRIVEGMEEIFGVTFVDATPTAEEVPAETWHSLAEETPPEYASLVLKDEKGGLFYAMREVSEAGDFLHCQPLDGGLTFLINLSVLSDRLYLWRLFDEFDE